jgi:GDP-mannose 6-dehydrogenase
VLIVGLGGAEIATALAQHTRPDQTIVDLINIADRTALRGEYVGLCW